MPPFQSHLSVATSNRPPRQAQDLHGPVIFVRVVYWISATVMSPVVLLIVAAPQSVALPWASNLQP
jgi:hypothetical protein